MKLKTIFKKVTAAALAATMVVGMAACVPDLDEGAGHEQRDRGDVQRVHPAL